MFGNVQPKASIKAPYACGRTGAFLHKVKLDSGRHYFSWVEGRRGTRGILTVKVECKHPSLVHDAILLDEIGEYAPGRKETAAVTPLALCKRCFTDEERDEVRSDRERASSEIIRLGRAVER